ncbi:hypothetical protein PPYR_07316 [Photinus pyralis]|uniref:Uncharacterized protein n=1 Tax=Photinus pyralis TaxID=7054 RepID=A0A5N4AQ62_PHOPY|nr:hypothetical protein PPYR_07316 [Photinus pyralis]
MSFQRHLPILTILISSGLCGYQPVKFIQNESSSNARTSSFSTLTIHNAPSRNPSNQRNRQSRSFNHILGTYPYVNQFWQDSIYLNPPEYGGVKVEIGRDGHITPDFSDGLAYPDPYLVTGGRALAIAKLLYSNEMFYNDFPHVSALLKNQQMRRENGLEEHRLGSSRPSSPFFNYRFQYVYLP